MQGLIGIDPLKVRTSAEGPEFVLGTVGWLMTSAGLKGYMYCQANGAWTALGYMVVVDSGFDAEHLTVTSSAPGAGFGRPVGAAQAAVADNGYGWIQIYGRGSIRTLASAALGTRLNSTATAGAVDDDGTASSEVINGISLGTATGGAEATNADGFFIFPYVSTTL